jgi:hypothetical protein
MGVRVGRRVGGKVMARRGGVDPFGCGRWTGGAFGDNLRVELDQVFGTGLDKVCLRTYNGRC